MLLDSVACRYGRGSLETTFTPRLNRTNVVKSYKRSCLERREVTKDEILDDEYQRHPFEFTGVMVRVSAGRHVRPRRGFRRISELAMRL
jgi:hypothetical protein